MYTDDLRSETITFKITPGINSRLNKLCGSSGFCRSKILRMALIDFMEDSNRYRKQVTSEIERFKKIGAMPYQCGA